jgi:tetratricopeptide (TPR) repeat protein
MSDSADLIADGVRAERAGALDRALDAFRTVCETSSDPDLCAQAYTHEADVRRAQCDWNAATAAARRAQGIAWDADLPERYLESLNAEANILSARGRFDEARPILERVVAGTTDPRLRGIALQNLGSILAQSGQRGAAERSFAESLGNFHKAGYERGECIALNNLGRLALDNGDPAGAQPLLERAFRIARRLEDHDLAALAGMNLGWSLCQSGDFDRAQDHAMEALGYFAGCENRWREIECFRLIGDINARCEDYANAERCYGIALSYAEQIDCAPEVRATRERIAELARARSRSAPRPAPAALAVDPLLVPPDADGGGGTSPTAGLS